MHITDAHAPHLLCAHILTSDPNLYYNPGNFSKRGVERSDVLGKITDPINRPGGALIKAADNTLLMLSQEIYLFRRRTIRIKL